MRVRGANSTMVVESVGLSQLPEFSVFSVDTSAFVDTPFERGGPVHRFSNSASPDGQWKRSSLAFDAFGEGRMRRPVRYVICPRQSVGTLDELSSCGIQSEACAVFAASQGWVVENGRFDDVRVSGSSGSRSASRFE